MQLLRDFICTLGNKYYSLVFFGEPNFPKLHKK